MSIKRIRGAAIALAFIVPFLPGLHSRAHAEPQSPRITSIRVDASSNELVICGTGFKLSAKVTVGKAIYLPVSATSSELHVKLGAPLAPGTYAVYVSQFNGDAHFGVAIGTGGTAGPAGPQGPKGDRGPAGPQGPTGPQGPKGDTGAAGPAGPAGSGGLSVFSGTQFLGTVVNVTPNDTTLHPVLVARQENGTWLQFGIDDHGVVPLSLPTLYADSFCLSTPYAIDMSPVPMFRTLQVYPCDSNGYFPAGPMAQNTLGYMKGQGPLSATCESSAGWDSMPSAPQQKIDLSRFPAPYTIQ